MPGRKPSPEVLALILCDQIITDRLTGKQSLIGMFSTVHSRGFPVSHPQLCVYVALTSGHGKSNIVIRIVDANESRPPVVEGRGAVEFKDPRTIANLALQFHGLVFPEPGAYRVQLFCESELLREARLELVKAQPRPRPTGPEPPPAAP